MPRKRSGENSGLSLADPETPERADCPWDQASTVQYVGRTDKIQQTVAVESIGSTVILRRVPESQEISATLSRISDIELEPPSLSLKQMHLSYFDRYVKTGDELPTVGILLCDDKNDAVVELTLPEDTNIYASRYQFYLPSKRGLAEQLESVR